MGLRDLVNELSKFFDKIEYIIAGEYTVEAFKQVDDSEPFKEISIYNSRTGDYISSTTCKLSSAELKIFKKNPSLFRRY